LTGPSGAEFSDVSVRDVLLRAANAGLSTYRGKVVGRGDWPAIVDADTFASVRAILTDPSRRRGVGKPPTTLLAGVLRCGICARRLNGAWRDGRLTYRCRQGCTSRTRDALDAAVSELVVARITMNARKLTRPRKTASRSVAKAIGEANALRGQVEAYLLRASEFDPADLAAILRALRARLAETEGKIVQEAGKPATYALVAAGDVISAWADLDTQGRRVVIAEQIERITVGPGLPGLLPGGKPAVTHNVEIGWRKD
jgi:hypothetical protein